MPRQNRVTPFGEIIATGERGTCFGNRGLLHDSEGRIRRPWQVKRWLLCVLEFKGRRRKIMAPGHYTELFFLDEATGLAAGHRPCSECRRDRFLAFRNAWPAGCLPACALDNQLHAERLHADGTKRQFKANLRDLPDGVIAMLGGHACLLWKGYLLAWSPGGYRNRLPHPKRKQVTVLTPQSTTEVIRAGYIPEVHPSAEDNLIWSTTSRSSGTPSPSTTKANPFSVFSKKLCGPTSISRPAIPKRYSRTSGTAAGGLTVPTPHTTTILL